MYVKENKRIKEYLSAEAQRTDGGDKVNLNLGRKPYLLLFPPTYAQFFVLSPATMDASPALFFVSAHFCTFRRCSTPN
jgi:hypothetical protein